MTSNYILLYSYIDTFASHNKKGFLLQQTRTHAQQDKEILNGSSPSNATHQTSGNPAEDQAKILRPRRKEGHQENKAL